MLTKGKRNCLQRRWREILGFGEAVCAGESKIFSENRKTLGHMNAHKFYFVMILTFLALANVKGYVLFFFFPSPSSAKIMEFSSMCAVNMCVSVTWDEWGNLRALYALLGPSASCPPALADDLDATEVTPHACIQVTKLSPCCASWKSKTGSVEAVLAETWCGCMSEWRVGHPWPLGRELRQLGLWIPSLGRRQRAPQSQQRLHVYPCPLI